jgi:hypothetical protein
MPVREVTATADATEMSAQVRTRTSGLLEKPRVDLALGMVIVRTDDRESRIEKPLLDRLILKKGSHTYTQLLWVWVSVSVFSILNRRHSALSPLPTTMDDRWSPPLLGWYHIMA